MNRLNPIKGNFNFSFSTTKKCFIDFEKEFNVKMKIITKGTRIGNKVSLYNRWIYGEKFSDNNFSDKLNFFLGNIIMMNDYVDSLSLRFDRSIDFYIRSEMGQLGYCLHSSAITLLSQLNLDVNYHILSFGYVSE